MATLVIEILSLYLLIGLVFALVFVTRGMVAIDESSKGAPIGFRLLIVPGSAVLWPLLAWKWWKS